MSRPAERGKKTLHPVRRSRAIKGEALLDMELDREMEYLVEPEEAEARGITEVE